MPLNLGKRKTESRKENVLAAYRKYVSAVQKFRGVVASPAEKSLIERYRAGEEAVNGAVTALKTALIVGVKEGTSQKEVYEDLGLAAEITIVAPGPQKVYDPSIAREMWPEDVLDRVVSIDQSEVKRLIKEGELDPELAEKAEVLSKSPTPRVSIRLADEPKRKKK